MTQSTGSTHPFVVAVIEANRSRLTAGLERMRTHIRDTGDLPPRAKESEDDPYDWLVFRRVIALIRRFERLREAVTLIRRLPSPRMLAELRTDRGGWIEYHYAAYLVALASVGDIALLLTSDVFELGIAKRSVSASAVKTNRWVRKSRVLAPLNAVEEQIKHHRERRNLYVHRGEGPELAEISDTGAYEYLEAVSLVQRLRPDEETERMLRRGYRDEAVSLATRLEAEMTLLRGVVDELFTALQPTYTERRESPRRPPAAQLLLAADKGTGR